MDNPLLRPDPGLFVWTILTFLVLVGLLTKFAWRPLLKALESRQETIRKSLDDAEMARKELERLNRDILGELHEQGIAAPSYTSLNGVYCLRVAIANHRSRFEDFDLLVRETLRIGRELETA